MVDLERIIKDAEMKRTKILNEIGILERGKEKLKAGVVFLECAIRDKPKQLQLARESQRTAGYHMPKKATKAPSKAS